MDEGVMASWSKKGLTLFNNDGTTIKIAREAEVNMFYLKVKRIKHKAEQVYELTKMQMMDINKVHEKCGHMSESVLKRVMANFGIQLTRNLEACDRCMKAKVHAKAVLKVLRTVATEPGERLYLDITGPFPPSVGGNIYDVKIVDQFSCKTWGAKVKKKSQVLTITHKHITGVWHRLGHIVRFEPQPTEHTALV